ncbi:FAD binding domain-containing protein [Hoyosella sp. YIM 151337]|uniref:FAD binding domain-containing protein n=1 Tax=Hoyosella sp. YIM 151337 TaxID=2992742 RepID=UPI00223550E0|nr:FAD binding domain-containing protein [Hoyosella sp. YIM 151337]MCW4355899.1 FAD binding domain-containing protein [Hoyosella sp. YIM 151337]
MDLPTITTVEQARTRADLRGMSPDCAFLAGGTWLFSEPQNQLNRLIDITTMGWPPLTIRDDGLEIAATCTIAQLVAHDYPAEWAAAVLFRQCADSLLASFKVWNAATVGGNMCMGLPAGSMISLGASLGATLRIWCPDGAERTTSVLEFVTGVQTTSLRSGEVLRSIHIPAAALTSSVAFRRISLAPQGRAGSVVIARETSDGPVLCISAATKRPYLIPARSGVDEAVPESAWYEDAHGAADWRRSVTALLAAEALAALGGAE